MGFGFSGLVTRIRKPWNLVFNLFHGPRGQEKTALWAVTAAAVTHLTTARGHALVLFLRDVTRTLMKEG
jgi:hypothetical protein